MAVFSLTSYIRTQHSGVPLKIKRLAEDPERFIWAVSIAQTRCISMQTRVGALVQELNMMIPYAGKEDFILLISLDIQSKNLVLRNKLGIS